MALIVYPAEDWDSFVSVLRADEIIGNFVDDAGFLAMDEATKEAYLRQTALQISLCKNITLPDDIAQGLEVAQCYLVTHAIGIDMIAYDPNDSAINSEAVDTIKVSYDTALKNGAGTFPPMVQSLLSPYGCTSTSGGFSQTYAGRS